MSAAASFPTDTDLRFVLDTAQRAGNELLAYYRAAPEQLGIEYKGPRDLVTAADHASQRLIVRTLRERFPGHGFLAEEAEEAGRASTHCQVESSGRPLWIIDPLDGTTNFTHGHPLFAISIAAWVDGVAVLAVVHAPALGETYFARRGAGACRLRVGSDAPEPLSVTTEEQPEKLLYATGFSYERREVAAGLRLMAQLLTRVRGIRRGGSAALDLAYVAAGVFGGFWEYYLKPHDVAAGALLIEEAGGTVTDVNGGSDYLHGRSIIAGPAPIQAMLLEALKDGHDHPGRHAAP